MKFTALPLPGAFVIAPEPIADVRGSFARVFCEREFTEHGIETRFAQHSVSRNTRAGTLRGMHFNAPPHEEAKLVSCQSGAIHDVIIDLRPNSPTFKQHAAVELSAENGLRLFIPRGFAHGFQSLTDHSTVLYMISDFYVPEAARTVRYDDPAFAIAWPCAVSVISDKDRDAPLFSAP